MFGSHLSVAGGMHNALLDARALKLDCVQVFTKNQQQWKVKPLADSVVDAWRTELAGLGWSGSRVVSHASYLINLASPDDELWEKSIGLMTVEIERCEALGIETLVHHPGAYTTSDADAGLTRIARAYERLLRSTKGYRTVVCLEDTVGSGSNLGRTFDELADLRGRILSRAPEPGRVGYCLDTCHMHAGGYDLSSRAKGEAVLSEFDALCGLSNVRALHLNDSLKDAGSRKDRHAHIGEGTIARRDGLESGGKVALKDTGFAAFVNEPAFAGIPKILETPKEASAKGTPMDAVNVRRLKRLLAA
ncbi:MAG: deoxyribonuclease IV [Planctomycetota bacterium]